MTVIKHATLDTFLDALDASHDAWNDAGMSTAYHPTKKPGFVMFDHPDGTRHVVRSTYGKVILEDERRHERRDAELVANAGDPGRLAFTWTRTLTPATRRLLDRMYRLASDLREDDHPKNREVGMTLDRWHKYGCNVTSDEVRELAVIAKHGAKRRVRSFADAIDNA